jgi:hypothetical protein
MVMKSKSLEMLLASESGLDSEMVTRFQKLRDNNLLSRSRGRNAEFLDADEIVSGILSMVASRPGFAALTAIGLRNLKPAGAQEDAFAGASTLAAALAAPLEDFALLATVKKVRLGDSDPDRRMPTSAEIEYRDGDKVRITQYVPATCLTQFGKGKEKGFDRHELNQQSVAQEIVIVPRLLVRIAREMKDSKAKLPYSIVLDSSGPLGDLFSTFSQAVDTARTLERAGHRILAIRRGSEILQGVELRTILGDTKPPAFENFPTASNEGRAMK